MLVTRWGTSYLSAHDFALADFDAGFVVSGLLRAGGADSNGRSPLTFTRHNDTISYTNHPTDSNKSATNSDNGSNGRTAHRHTRIHN